MYQFTWQVDVIRILNHKTEKSDRPFLDSILQSFLDYIFITVISCFVKKFGNYDGVRFLSKIMRRTLKIVKD